MEPVPCPAILSLRVWLGYKQRREFLKLREAWDTMSLISGSASNGSVESAGASKGRRRLGHVADGFQGPAVE